MSNSKPISTKSVLTISMVTLGAMSGGVTTSAHAQAVRETAPVEYRAPSSYSQYRVPQPTEYAPVSQGAPLEQPDVQYYEKVEEASRQRVEAQRQAAQRQTAQRQTAQRQAQSTATNRTTTQQTINQQSYGQQYINQQPQELLTQQQGQLGFQQGVPQTRYGNSPMTFGDAANVQTPAFQTPNYSTAQLGMQTPEFTTPQMSVPNASIPQTAFSVPSATLPSMGVPAVQAQAMTLPNIAASGMSIPGNGVARSATSLVGNAAQTGVQMGATAAASQAINSGSSAGVGLAASAALGIAGKGASMIASKLNPFGGKDKKGKREKVSFSNEELMNNDVYRQQPDASEYPSTSQPVRQSVSFEQKNPAMRPMQRLASQQLPAQGMAHLAAAPLLQTSEEELLGDAVEVLPGDTLYRISERYRIALRALVETNNLQPPFELEVGSYLYLPPPNIHVVEAGETLYAISRRYNVDTRSLANMNGLPKPWTIYPGDQMILPSLARDSFASEETAIASADAAVNAMKVSGGVATPVVGEVALGSIAVATNEIPASAMQPDPAKLASASSDYGRFDEEVTAQPKSVSANIDLPSNSKGFLWPVSGNLVKAYGKDASGKKNDGINIGARAGAPIKAASDGYVVYAGSELPGFGFLVLINHGGGWVTAYAHAKELLVEEGQAIRQGQTIAKVGETGSVDSPQLHFQLRKGKTPIDPTNQLSGKRAI